MQQIRQQVVLIASGTSLSGPSADMRNEQLVGVIMSSGWDPAAMSFRGSIDGSTWGDVFLSTGELSFPSADVAANRVLLFDSKLTPGLRFVQVRSGLTAAAVNQTADRIITLLSRDMVQ